MGFDSPVPTMRAQTRKSEYVNRRTCLYADLYQLAGESSVERFDHIARQIHIITFKIKSFSGGKNNEQD